MPCGCSLPRPRFEALARTFAEHSWAIEDLIDPCLGAVKLAVFLRYEPLLLLATPMRAVWVRRARLDHAARAMDRLDNTLRPVWTCAVPRSGPAGRHPEVPDADRWGRPQQLDRDRRCQLDVAATRIMAIQIEEDVR